MRVNSRQGDRYAVAAEVAVAWEESPIQTRYIRSQVPENHTESGFTRLEGSVLRSVLWDIKARAHFTQDEWF